MNKCHHCGDEAEHKHNGKPWCGHQDCFLGTKAACYKCEAVTPIRARVRDVKTSDGRQLKGLLVGVCCICDSVISLPHSSVGEVADQLNGQ